LQVRDVPADIHRRLKVRAAEMGQTMSDYVKEEIRLILDRPTIPDLRERLRSRAPVKVRPAPAEAVRQDRDTR